MPDRVPQHVVLSRTDSIGDVMLTLPLAGLLREHFPGIRITFLGLRYTAPVLRCCRHVDQVLTLEEVRSINAVALFKQQSVDALIHVFPSRQVAEWGRKADIAYRIGTSHRWWHWITCNHRVDFSRKRSDLHEAQLNMKLLAPLGFDASLSTTDLADRSGFVAPRPDATIRDLLRPGRKQVILHPLSKGSAVEWGLDHFTELIHLLDPQRFHVIITGTAAEAERYRTALPVHLSHVTDAGGRLSLEQLIMLIGASDALVAASTGPLHMAAACGIRAIGLYASTRPIHPGRWAPIGRDVHVLEAAEAAATEDPLAQIRAIDAARVAALLEQLP